MAWHCANSYGNANYASWEVCQSEGDLSQFLRNEQAVLDDVAKYMKQWSLTPNHDTVKLHQELSATSCPRRSVEVHGGTVESCRSYFITELNKRITGRNTNTNTEKRKYKMFAIYSDGSNKQLYILNVATGKENKITNDERKAILADNVMKEMVVDFGKANRTSLGKSNEALKKFR